MKMNVKFEQLLILMFVSLIFHVKSAPSLGSNQKSSSSVILASDTESSSKDNSSESTTELTGE